MKKLLLALLLAPLLALAQVPQNVQKSSGALTAGFTVPSGVSITATGTGTISATSVTGFSPASGKILTLSNSLTLAGTDGTTMTFPTTTATIARTDAGQTFTGTQTFGALVATTLNGNAFTTGTGTLTIAAGKTLTASNTLTFTGTDAVSVAFGAGGTVAYTSGSVASITGTSNQIAASASTGAVTLSLAGPHNFTTLTSTALLLGGGTSAVNASDMTYASPTLSVPAGFTVSAAGALNFTAAVNTNITLTTSGTGIFSVPESALFSAASGDLNLDLSRIAGQNGSIRFQTALSNRWLIRVSSTAESGNNAGSDFVWNARSDAGGNLGNVFQVTRATGKLSVQPVSGSIAAWGTTGALFAVNPSVNTATITDSSSSGTVADAVANSFGQPTFAASSATIYTNSSNLDVLGDVIAGTNVTNTNSWGFRNRGKTRLDGTAAYGALPSGATTVGTILTLPANTFTVTGTNTATTFQAGYYGAPTFTDASVGTISDAFNSVFVAPAAAGGSLVITRSHTIGILDSTDAATGGVGAFVVANVFGTNPSVGIGNGKIYASGAITGGSTITVASIVTSTLASSGSTVFVANGTGYASFLVGFSQQNAANTDNLSIAQTGATYAGVLNSVGNNNSYISAPNKLVIARGTGATAAFTFDGTTLAQLGTTDATTGGAGSVTTAGGIYSTKKIITGSTLTTLGGATFHTTSSALTDGAGVLVATLTNSPVTGNPTKWIGINDNGTTRYIPAF